MRAAHDPHFASAMQVSFDENIGKHFMNYISKKARYNYYT